MLPHTVRIARELDLGGVDAIAGGDVGADSAGSMTFMWGSWAVLRGEADVGFEGFQTSDAMAVVALVLIGQKPCAHPWESNSTPSCVY